MVFLAIGMTAAEKCIVGLAVQGSGGESMERILAGACVPAMLDNRQLCVVLSM